jgi:hypothetical protein
VADALEGLQFLPQISPSGKDCVQREVQGFVALAGGGAG